MKYLLLVLIILQSCEKPKPTVIRNQEQINALKSDTLLLNFRLYMSESEYKVNWAKNFVNKKIVELNDGTYRYAVKIDGKYKYALIEPKFLHDSLVIIELKFNDFVGKELLDILTLKYGSVNIYSKEYKIYSWSDSSKKIVTLYNDDYPIIKYEDIYKGLDYLHEEYERSKTREDSLKRVIKKDL